MGRGQEHRREGQSVSREGRKEDTGEGRPRRCKGTLSEEARAEHKEQAWQQRRSEALVSPNGCVVGRGRDPGLRPSSQGVSRGARWCAAAHAPSTVARPRASRPPGGVGEEKGEGNEDV